MTQLLTTHTFRQLVHAIARDGLEPHEEAISQIAALTNQSGLYPGAAGLLGDALAPNLVRSRAFMIIARNWDEITAAASRWATFGRAFDAFVAQWTEHQQLRKTSDIEGLWTSRTKLDRLRADMALHRSLAC